jgi:hypothetical protein
VDDLGFDRLVKGLAASSGRRQAVLATLGGIFAGTVASGMDEAEAKKKKKKPFCLNGQTVEVSGKKAKKKLLQQGATAGACPIVPPAPPPPQSPPPPPPCTNLTGSCTASSQCCGASAGDAICRAHVKAACTGPFPGQRCCALEGELCNINLGDCECCDDLVCGIAGDNKFRCQPVEP